jgi:hypothetical protein
MLLFWVLLKGVLETALLAMVGRWVLGVLLGEHRVHNLFYRVLDTLVMPFVALARRCVAGRVAEARLQALVFVVLGVLWLLTTVAKIQHCWSVGVALCR